MITITPVRTPRITAEMQELTAGDVIDLCALPADQHERGATELLKRIVKPEDKPRVGQVTDVRLWTVQERAFVIAHYIAHVAEDGPDFSVGEQGKYSDYIVDGIGATPEQVSLGVVAEDNWSLGPLLGAHAESIERLVTSGRLAASRVGWWVGCMAAQLLRAGDDPFDTANRMDADLDEHIAERAQIFMAFPESDFMDLLQAFLLGNDKLEHLLRVEFIDDGLVFMPKEEAPGKNPARFPVSAAISQRAAQALGRPE